MGIGIFFYFKYSHMRVFKREIMRKFEKGAVAMKDMLKQMQAMEVQMNEAQDQAEYWMEEEHFDMKKSDRFEQEADVIYESLHKLFNQAADKIVSITSGQIDKVTAMKMIRCRRSEVERIFL